MFSGLINNINTNQKAETETEFMDNDGGIHQQVCEWGGSSTDFQTLEVVEADEAALLITAQADGLETAH